MTAKTAFIIDDEIFIALDIEAIMLDLGFEVLGPAYNLTEGFELISGTSATPSIALMDINIGGELVWPLAEKMQSMGTKILFISANSAHPELLNEFSACGVIDKPASHENVKAAVEQLLSNKPPAVE